MGASSTDSNTLQLLSSIRRGTTDVIQTISTNKPITVLPLHKTQSHIARNISTLSFSAVPALKKGMTEPTTILE